MLKYLVVFLVTTIELVAQGSIYYVAETGLNTNTGTQMAPWRTIQHAADEMQPGDEVRVLDGNFAGFETVTSGLPGLPIRFVAWGNDVVIDSGENSRGDLINIEGTDYIVIEGFKITSAGRAGIAVLGTSSNHVRFVSILNCNSFDNFRWGIFTGYAEDILIEGNTCSGSSDEHGIYVSNSADRPIIRGNIVFDNASSGIQINADPVLPGDGIISEAEISGNIIHNNGASGGGSINLASVRNSDIFNNLIYDNLNTGIALWDDGFDPAFGCQNNRIVHNTVLMATGGRWACGLVNGSINNEIRDNILLHLGSRGGLEIDASSLPGLVCDYNVIHRISDRDEWILLPEWQNRGFGLNSVDALPDVLFEDWMIDQFELISTSPARDAGIEVGVSVDLNHHARPVGSAPDTGCYEYGSSISTCGTDLFAYFPLWLGESNPPDVLDTNANGWIEISDIVSMVNCLE